MLAGSTNVALAANGGVATSSSNFSSGTRRPAPSTAIARDSTGTTAAAGRAPPACRNGCRSSSPARKTINRVVVYDVQDNYPNPVEPTDTMTNPLYGSSFIDFTVSAGIGGNWVTSRRSPNNNLVKRTVTFPAVTTDRIRVTVTRSADAYARLTEIEAFTAVARRSGDDDDDARELGQSGDGGATRHLHGDGRRGQPRPETSLSPTTATRSAAARIVRSAAASEHPVHCCLLRVACRRHASHRRDLLGRCRQRHVRKQRAVAGRQSQRPTTTTLASSAESIVWPAHRHLHRDGEGKRPDRHRELHRRRQSRSAAAAISRSPSAPATPAPTTAARRLPSARIRSSRPTRATLPTPPPPAARCRRSSTRTAPPRRRRPSGARPNPSLAGATVTFTATVTGTNDPTGSVSFTDGGTPISGCTNLPFTAGSGNTRTAACGTALVAGTHPIVATYAGDAANATSASSALSQVVNAAPPASTRPRSQSSANPSVAGSRPSPSRRRSTERNSPTGSVSFTDDGSADRRLHQPPVYRRLRQHPHRRLRHDASPSARIRSSRPTRAMLANATSRAARCRRSSTRHRPPRRRRPSGARPIRRWPARASLSRRR